MSASATCNLRFCSQPPFVLSHFTFPSSRPPQSAQVSTGEPFQSEDIHFTLRSTASAVILAFNPRPLASCPSIEYLPRPAWLLLGALSLSITALIIAKLAPIHDPQGSFQRPCASIPSSWRFHNRPRLLSQPAIDSIKTICTIIPLLSQFSTSKIEARRSFYPAKHLSLKSNSPCHILCEGSRLCAIEPNHHHSITALWDHIYPFGSLR